MEKISPPAKESKISNKVNYTLPMEILINIIKWLSQATIKLTTLDLCTVITLTYIVFLLAVFCKLVGVFN